MNVLMSMLSWWVGTVLFSEYVFFNRWEALIIAIPYMAGMAMYVSGFNKEEFSKDECVCD
jgi:hypothetical protein